MVCGWEVVGNRMCTHKRRKKSHLCRQCPMIVAASRPLNMNSCWLCHFRLVIVRHSAASTFPKLPLAWGMISVVSQITLPNIRRRCVVAKPTKHTEIDLFPMSRAIRFGTRTKIRGIFRAAQELDLMEDSGRYGIISS